MNRFSFDHSAAGGGSRLQAATADEMAHWRGIDPARWEEAEKGWGILAGTWLTMISHVMPLRRSTRILQVGGAARDAIHYLPPCFKVNVDPLAAFYAAELPWARDDSVHALAGYGEFLPFGDECFDLVLADNSVDHVVSPVQVLAEMSRVLRPGGVLAMSVFIFLPPRARQRQVGEDPCHPHTFSERAAIARVAHAGFEVMTQFQNDTDEPVGDKQLSLIARRSTRVVRNLLAEPPWPPQLVNLNGDEAEAFALAPGTTWRVAGEGGARRLAWFLGSRQDGGCLTVGARQVALRAGWQRVEEPVPANGRIEIISDAPCWIGDALLLDA
jgi:SAM-dependent methyltransferase